MTLAIQSTARTLYAAAAPRFRETNAVCIEARAVRDPALPQGGLHILAQLAGQAASAPYSVYAPPAGASGSRINIFV